MCVHVLMKDIGQHWLLAGTHHLEFLRHVLLLRPGAR